MSWSNCSVCGKYKYIPDMVKYKALSGITMLICKFCQSIGQKEMDRSVFWMPEVDYDKVKNSVSIDVSKDRIPKEVNHGKKETRQEA